jgi:hypothetical protein
MPLKSKKSSLHRKGVSHTPYHLNLAGFQNLRGFLFLNNPQGHAVEIKKIVLMPWPFDKLHLPKQLDEPAEAARMNFTE